MHYIVDTVFMTLTLVRSELFFLLRQHDATCLVDTLFMSLTSVHSELSFYLRQYVTALFILCSCLLFQNVPPRWPSG